MVVMVGWVICRALPKDKFSFSPVCDRVSSDLLSYISEIPYEMQVT